MTEDIAQDQTADAVSALRDEMNEQFAQLKASFEAQMQEKEAELVRLKDENQSLHRALVRSAVMDAPKEEKPKTERELYEDRIKVLADKTLRLMRN